MRKLENNIQDKEFLKELLDKNPNGLNAIFGLGVFTTEYIDGFKIIDYHGIVKFIDIESGYCKWTNENGREMPTVNLNCITLKDY